MSDKCGRRQAAEEVVRASLLTKGGGKRAIQRAAAAQVALQQVKAKGALQFLCQAIDDARAAGFSDPKAMVVVRSRAACVAYRSAMLTQLHAQSPVAPPRVLVAFSGLVGISEPLEAEELGAEAPTEASVPRLESERGARGPALQLALRPWACLPGACLPGAACQGLPASSRLERGG